MEEMTMTKMMMMLMHEIPIRSGSHPRREKTEDERVREVEAQQVLHPLNK
jgi:hypothetical protein